VTIQIINKIYHKVKQKRSPLPSGKGLQIFSANENLIYCFNLACSMLLLRQQFSHFTARITGFDAGNSALLVHANEHLTHSDNL